MARPDIRPVYSVRKPSLSSQTLTRAESSQSAQAPRHPGHPTVSSQQTERQQPLPANTEPLPSISHSLPSRTIPPPPQHKAVANIRCQYPPPTPGARVRWDSIDVLLQHGRARMRSRLRSCRSQQSRRRRDARPAARTDRARQKERTRGRRRRMRVL
eukprot:6192693-Pleurochrysis_carterae.AAC.3